jgi:hypothetical protein
MQNTSPNAINDREAPNNKNMTLMIMTLNDNQQLLDVLDTLSPHLQNQNLAILKPNVTPNNMILNQRMFNSPGLVTDSLKLNTQRMNKANKIKSKPKLTNIQTNTLTN